MKRLFHLFTKTVYILAIVIVTIIFYRAFMSKKQSDLREWHTIKPDAEPILNEKFLSIEDFVNRDSQYIKENFNKIKLNKLEHFQRYNKNSISYSFKNGNNFNASFVLDPGIDSTKGVMLLLHGLSDSPYHIKDLAEHYYAKGYYVFALRLPGHGTLPSGLLDVKWQDWYKAVEWSVNKIIEKSQERNNCPFYLGGFSTGAALCLHYVYEAVDENDDDDDDEAVEMPIPEKLFLFSPAIGVDPTAKIAGWHKTLSWLDYFKKFAWLDIIPEYDPAKYNSFTKNAGRQIYLLCKENKEMMEDIIEDDEQNKLPPIIAFDSWVDATVIVDDLIEMYQKIGLPKDELVIFDVNRIFEPFMKKNIIENSPLDIEFRKDNAPNYYIIANRIDDLGNYTDTVGLFKVKLGEKVEEVFADEFAWPKNYYAMSHIGLPIAPTNDLYGSHSALSKIQAHGERDVLIITSDDLSRIKYNPFFNLMTKELDRFILN
jgi:alpha-beta hydrolase superfamily lysophospholipase